MKLFGSFTPLVEAVSLDEAYLEVAGARRLFGPPGDIARRIRADLQIAESLACSVGVGPNKMLAKLASRAAKPRAGPGGVEPGPGVVVIEARDALSFLHRLPVRSLSGVGPATLRRLRDMGRRDRRRSCRDACRCSRHSVRQSARASPGGAVRCTRPPTGCRLADTEVPEHGGHVPEGRVGSLGARARVRPAGRLAGLPAAGRPLYHPHGRREAEVRRLPDRDPLAAPTRGDGPCPAPRAGRRRSSWRCWTLPAGFASWVSLPPAS